MGNFAQLIYNLIFVPHSLTYTILNDKIFHYSKTITISKKY